jgi:hypothetical protein
MTTLKKTYLATALAAAMAGISTGVSAQYYDPGYGGYAGGVYAGPGYYDEGVVVRRAPVSPYWGYGYGHWTPSRDSACIQDRRDFAERTNFICR